MRWYLHAVLSQVQAAEAARSAENSYAKDEGTPEDTQALVLRGVPVRHTGKGGRPARVIFRPASRLVDDLRPALDDPVLLAHESPAALAAAVG